MLKRISTKFFFSGLIVVVLNNIVSSISEASWTNDEEGHWKEVVKHGSLRKGWASADCGWYELKSVLRLNNSSLVSQIEADIKYALINYPDLTVEGKRNYEKILSLMSEMSNKNSNFQVPYLQSHQAVQQQAQHSSLENPPFRLSNAGRPNNKWNLSQLAYCAWEQSEAGYEDRMLARNILETKTGKNWSETQVDPNELRDTSNISNYHSKNVTYTSFENHKNYEASTNYNYNTSSIRNHSDIRYQPGDKIGENAYYVDSDTWMYYTANGACVRVKNGHEID